MKEISKLCADSLRSFSQTKFGVDLKSSHAHELVAAYFGYSSRAALLADKKHPISNLPQAEFIVLVPTEEIKDRRNQLKGLPPDLPEDLVEGVYLPIYKEGLVLKPIWPRLEELGSALADQYLKLKVPYFNDMKVLRHGVKIESHNDEVAIVVFREYVSPSHSLSFQHAKRGVVDVFNLRRIAGFIGYVKTNHYSAEAETLDAAIHKMRDAYHGKVNDPQLTHVGPALEAKLSFPEWLMKQKKRDSPLGDLAVKRKFLDKGEAWPLYNNLKDYQDYVMSTPAPRGAMEALERAWKSYHIYLRTHAC